MQPFLYYQKYDFGIKHISALLNEEPEAKAKTKVKD